MTELMQALRDMSRDRFELFVHQFLRARYPAANITKIAGDGGDQGIDSFSGTLSNGPAVWQAKHFVNGIGPSQKSQILSFLQTALAAKSLSYWTLCLPVNLNIEQMVWFQEKVETPYADRCTIRLLQASEIVAEVAHSHDLLKTYFYNNLISQALAVRETILSTEGVTIPALHLSMEEHRKILVDRYSSIDPRFSARVTIGPTPQQPCNQPGVVLSEVSDHFRIDFVPRDLAAYRDDPLHTRFSMTPEQAKKFEEALDKGVPLTLPVTDFKASTPLLAELENLAGAVQLRVSPGIPPQFVDKPLLVKLVTGDGSCPVLLSLFDLRLVRFGRMEFELKSTSDSPIGLSVLGSRAIGELEVSLQLRMQMVGADVRAASKAIRFLDTLERSGQLQVVALENDERIMSANSGYRSTFSVAPDVTALIHRAAEIAEHFNKALMLPPRLSRDDLNNAEMLHSVATGKPFEMAEWSLDILKEGGSQIDRIKLLTSTEPFNLHLTQPNAWRTFTLFDTNIETGPVSIGLTKCSLKFPGKLLDTYGRTAVRRPFRMEFRVNGPCRFIPPSPSEPEDPLLGTGGGNGRLEISFGH
jgi:hypothetical protein